MISFGDSIHDFDTIDEHSSFKRSIPHYILSSMKIQPKIIRNERSVQDDRPEVVTNSTDDGHDCHPKYIGHELDPLIARQLRYA